MSLIRRNFRAFGAALSSRRRVENATQGKKTTSQRLFKPKTIFNESDTQNIFLRGVQKGYISKKMFKQITIKNGFTRIVFL
jgi:hypothetical protein